MQKYLDRENERIITEKQLKAEYEEIRADGGTDAETFEQYIKNCTDKNGTLEPIRMTLCPHCLAGIRSRGEKINGVLIYPDDYADEENEIDDESEAQSFCDWCEEAGHLEIYAII